MQEPRSQPYILQSLRVLLGSSVQLPSPRAYLQMDCYTQGFALALLEELCYL